MFTELKKFYNKVSVNELFEVLYHHERRGHIQKDYMTHKKNSFRVVLEKLFSLQFKMSEEIGKSYFITSKVFKIYTLKH